MKNTMLAAMGFEDHDLKTPEHDQIMLWLNENAGDVVSKVWSFFGFDKEHGSRSSPRPALQFSGVSKITWEHPVMNGRGGVIGFVDMVIQSNGTFIDESGNERIAIVETYIEVKSAIKSIGEVIRQVRAYGEKPFIVVCPDARFADVIRSQRIAFVQSPVFSVGPQNKLF